MLQSSLSMITLVGVALTLLCGVGCHGHTVVEPARRTRSDMERAVEDAYGISDDTDNVMLTHTDADTRHIVSHTSSRQRRSRSYDDDDEGEAEEDTRRGRQASRRGRPVEPAEDDESWEHACRGEPSQTNVDCCCNCDADYIPCPDFAQLRPFDALLTGTVEPATWPWVDPIDAETKLKRMGWNLSPDVAAQGGPVFTWILSDGHTGSSALAGYLASSPNLGTLCDADVWNCEGEKILMHLAKSMPRLTARQRGLLKRGEDVDIDWFRVRTSWPYYV